MYYVLAKEEENKYWAKVCARSACVGVRVRVDAWVGCARGCVSGLCAWVRVCGVRL